MERAREMLSASAFFTKEYLKTEILDRSLSLIVKDSSLCREKSDYDDFYIASHTLIGRNPYIFSAIITFTAGRQRGLLPPGRPLTR